MPGSSYIEKILKFIETHYKIGELFFEYLYRGCCTESTEYCSFCSDQGWTSPLPIKGIPQPIPDAKELFHFKPVNETPITDENGKPRAPDDFQPRANIKRLLSEGTLSCKEEVEQFSNKFAVEQDLVQAYIAHLQDLKIQSNIRARGRNEQKNKRAQKTVEEYAWLELVQCGNIKKLLVSELEKYLKHYKLSSSGKKADKIRKISLHVLGADEGGGKHVDDKSLKKATEMLEDVSEGENENEQ